LKGKKTFGTCPVLKVTEINGFLVDCPNKGPGQNDKADGFVVTNNISRAQCVKRETVVRL